jgi:hypothetical protein
MDYWVTHVAGQERLGGSRLSLVGRPRRTMWMCDGKLRLQKGRSMAVSEKLFMQYFDEFQKQAAAKLIRVQCGGPVGPDFDFAQAAEPVQDQPIAPEYTPSPPPPPPPPPAPEPEPEPVVEPEPEPEPAKPVDKMTKAELVEYLVAKGFSPDELSQVTKRELLEEAKALNEAD